MSEAGTLPRRSRNWPFYLSLFFNVVLLTALALGVFKAMQWRDGPMGMGPWMPRQVERALPDAPREKVRAIREAHEDEFRPLFQAVRDARDGIRTALDAEPFAADSLRAALAEMRRADQAVAEASANVIVEIASVLTPDERKLVREKFREKRKERRNGPRGDKDDDMMPPPDGDGPPPPDGDGPPPPPGSP